MRHLFIIILGLLLSIALKGQNKIDRTGNLEFGYFSQADGLSPVYFNGQYRIYSHGGFLMIGYKASVNDDPRNRSTYRYKGKLYYASQIPEIRDIRVKSVTGTIRVFSYGVLNLEREVEISIGGYADNAGSLGGNNFILLEKLPDNLEPEVVRFTPRSISIDASKAHQAIESLLQKEKDKETAKENQQKYRRILSEADNLFAAENYDHALAKYYEASYVAVSDKSQAEQGITKTRNKLLEESEEVEAEAQTNKAAEEKDKGQENATNEKKVEQEKKEEESDALREARIKMYQAGQFSSEGDRLFKLGVMSWPAALQQYQKAQEIWYTESVQQQISKINAATSLADGFNKAGDALEQGIDNIDPRGITKHVFSFIDYAGLQPDFKDIQSPNKHSAYDVAFGFNGSRLFLNYEVRLVYQKTPNVSYMSSEPNEVISASYGILGLGLSGGLAVPLFNNMICIYGNYGYNAGLTVSREISEGYEVLETYSDVTNDYTTWKPSGPVAVGRMTGGIFVRIPKTGIGINFRYVSNWFKTPEEDTAKLKRLSDEREIEFGAPLQPKIKYNYLGIGFAFQI